MPELKKLLEGKFARVGISLVPSAIVTFVDEGKLEENTFDDDEAADERLTIGIEVNGERKIITPNLTSMRELGKAWGTHSKNWVGKKAKVTVEKKQVFGQTKDVAFLHPIVGVGPGGAQQQKPSAIVEEMILDLEMSSTPEEFNKKLGEFAPKINKLTGNDKVVFLREKQNVELRWS